MSALTIGQRNRRFYRLLLALMRYKDKNHIWIARGSRLLASQVVIEKGTRINGPCVAKGRGGLVVGRYCAVGHDVKFITSNHVVSGVSLNVALLARLGINVRCDVERMGIRVGHNVWIGDDAIILPGVQLGNGSVVGAGAVVTKDVPAYAVYAGNPGRMIRYRFDSDVIRILEASRWWEMSEEEMRRHRGCFELASLRATDDALVELASTATPGHIAED